MAAVGVLMRASSALSSLLLTLSGGAFAQAADAGLTPATPAALEAPPLAPAGELPGNDEERKALLAKLSREELGELLKALPEEKMIALGRTRLAAMNSYSARLIKEERIDGDLHKPQTLEVHV